jgi:hypothetical protein
VRAIWGLVVGVLVLAGGCASGQQTPPSDAVDLNGQPGQGETTVVVDNQNLNEMTIFAYQGSQRMRLGRARATAITKLRIPTSIVSGVVQLRFFAQPLGNQRSYLSELIPVQPGDQVDWLIPYTR